MATTANQLLMPGAFDPSKIQFEPLARNQRGGKSIKVGYQGCRGYVRLQTPELHLPFGLSVFDEEDRSKTSTSMECSLDARNGDQEKMRKFMQMMQALDEAVFQHCLANSVECFGKQMTADMLREAFFRPIVREGKLKPDNTRYPPQMRVKVSSLAPPKLFDAARNEMEWETEAGKYKGHVVKMILQIQPVWFVNKMFGLSLRLQQMIVMHAPTPDNACLFVDDGSASSLPPALPPQVLPLKPELVVSVPKGDPQAPATKHEHPPAQGTKQGDAFVSKGAKAEPGGSGPAKPAIEASTRIKA